MCTAYIHEFGLIYVSVPLGASVILRHVRRGVELPPIDQNLFYDFDYQQVNHITPRVVLPVSKNHVIKGEFLYVQRGC